MKSSKSTKTSQYRIIAGTWRRRKLAFLPLDGLRPTPDRVRETLFNWLVADIQTSHCLDLFAGSGALGFEALSRGAASLTSIDLALKAIKLIKQNAEYLQTNNVYALCSPLPEALNSLDKRYNIVFIDPPYQQYTLIQNCLSILIEKQLLADQCKIYIETHKQQSLQLPTTISIQKQRQFGQVKALLTTFTAV